MTEQSENQADEIDEAPEAQDDEHGQTHYGPHLPVGATGYRESADHVPDPTAMTGTLETTGTGGGHNERLTGTTRIFSAAETVVDDEPAEDSPEGPAPEQESSAKTAPAKKTAAKK